MKPLHTLAIIIFCLFTANKAHSQARSSAGFGTSVNFPLHNGYASGHDWFLQGSVKLFDRLEIMPSIGIVTLESDKKGIYNGYYFVGSGRGVDMFYASATAKYYFNNLLFAVGGVSVNAGGEDLGSVGPGGHLGAGINLNIDQHNAFEITGLIQILPDYDQFVPLAVIRAAYRFNMGR